MFLTNATKRVFKIMLNVINTKLNLFISVLLVVNELSVFLIVNQTTANTGY